MKKGQNILKFRSEASDSEKGVYLTCHLGKSVSEFIAQVSDKTGIPRANLARIALANFINKVMEKEHVILGAKKDLNDIQTAYKHPERANEIFNKMKEEVNPSQPEEDKAFNKIVQQLQDKYGDKGLDEVIKSLRKKKKELQEIESQINDARLQQDDDKPQQKKKKGKKQNQSTTV